MPQKSIWVLNIPSQRSSKGRLGLNYECSFILSCFKKCQSTIIKNQFWQSQQGAVRSCPGLVACWLSTWPATRQSYIAKPRPDHFATIRQTSIAAPPSPVTSQLVSRKEKWLLSFRSQPHIPLPSQAGYSSPIIESNNECCCLDYRYPMFWQLSMTHESFCYWPLL